MGGVLRDLILGRQKENPDFDFCLKKGAISFARALAKEIRAGFVILDMERGAVRLVKKLKHKIYTLDFTDFRGRDIEEDLMHRDFTVNSIALKLEEALTNKDLSSLLIDPYRGSQDLQLKVIKTANKTVFIEDPLRILRAFSFSSLLGFRIEEETLRLAKSQKNRLSMVSSERIRDELFKIFDAADTFLYLEGLNKLRILEIIFPETKAMRGIGQGPYHHLDVWEHTLETVRQLDFLLKDIKDKEILNYLNEFISGERRRSALLKLGAILHDIGKPDALRHKEGKIIFHGHERIGLGLTEEISRRLRLSNDEINSLRKIVLCHLRPGYLAGNQTLTARARFRYFRDSGDEAASILLLSIADQRATKGPLTRRGSRIRHEKTCFRLIGEYFRKKNDLKLPRLLNGDLLMRRFKLAPSPLIGKILSEIEEFQAIGRIKTKAEAFRAAQKIIGRNRYEITKSQETITKQ
ncbi:MAG: HD domain-containing protein [Candidatus Omnitrophota bacterium]|nr:HD domain-containing protein [Candidatus Omnitrophota bacterium]